MRIDELVDEGYAPDEARRMAEMAFGDAEAFRAQCVVERRREARMTWMREVLGNVVGDLRYALRGIGKNPGFAVSVVLTLGLGIGATTAIFSVVDTLLIRDLPFPEPDELYQVQADYGGFYVPSLPSELGQAFVESPDGLRGAFLAARTTAVREDGGEPETVFAQGLEPGLSDLLGIAPALGRTFNEGDAEPGAAPVVALAHGFWTGRMGGDPGVIGREMVLDGRRYTVVAVMPRTFQYPMYGTTHLYAPLAADGTVFGRPVRDVEVLMRLRPDEVERLGAVAEAHAAALMEDVPERSRWTPHFAPINTPRANPDMKRALYVTFGAASIMLLVAMVNGINLLMVRGSSRAREIGVRLALGGSRKRVVAQLLTESAVLALLAGAVAVTLAWFGVDALWGMAPRELTLPARSAVRVDERVLVFAGALTVTAGLLFGLLPAVHSVRAGSATSSASLGAHAGRGRTHQRGRAILVVGQVALSLTLLFGAALLGRSFYRLVSQDPGLEVDGLLAMDLSFSAGRYAGADERAATVRAVRERLAGIPTVTDVAVGGSGLPGSGITFGGGLYLEGESVPVYDGDLVLPFAEGEQGLRRTLGTRLLAGRDFADSDLPSERKVLISMPLARKLGATTAGDVVGKRFAMEEGGRYAEIIGVVEALRLEGLNPVFTDDAMIRLRPVDSGESHVGFLVRTSGPAAPVLDAMRAAVLAVDPGQPVASLQTVDDGLWESAQRPRFFMTLMVVFALCGLTLAGVGLYGLVSYAVSQRTRELGIRLALGAHAADVRSMVLRSGLGLAAGGTVLGAAASLYASRVMEGLLFETQARDVTALAATAAVLLTVAALASYLPARRATRVNPVEVLKAE